MTRKPCCRDVWKESDQEEDGVVPSNWIAGKYLWWPSNEKGKKKTSNIRAEGSRQGEMGYI